MPRNAENVRKIFAGIFCARAEVRTDDENDAYMPVLPFGTGNARKTKCGRFLRPGRSKNETNDDAIGQCHPTVTHRATVG